MATKSIAWNTGNGNITLTYQGQGDGPISIQSDANDIGSARSQVITVETVGGAITRNFTINQAACPFPVGDVKNFAYTGSYQEVELPAGQYKLQCWGAQGGSNAAASSYGITAKAGGKGGYSEGVLTLSTKTTVRVYVGGQGSSSGGGFNGGGSTTGSSTYNASNEQGVSRMGGGGGATDIRLSDGDLLSRMIVAGGGAGGAMCYRYKTTSTSNTIYASTSGVIWSDGSFRPETSDCYFTNQYIPVSIGDTITYNGGWYKSSDFFPLWGYSDSNGNGAQHFGGSFTQNGRISFSVTITSSSIKYVAVWGLQAYNPRITITSSSSTSSNESQVGGVGGGTQGGAYSSTYAGKQNAAGSGGAFGQGAAQSVTNYRYCSGAGGGGWYGGGSSYSDSSMTNSKDGGGGSGFVNTAASAGNRPSGYTGLQLDSGSTTAGSSSFPSTSGGTETGHSGNGYAKITRLA